MYNKEINIFSYSRKENCSWIVSTSDINKIKTKTQIRKDNFYQLCHVG